MQRRALIEWCRLFARPGQWQSIRSYRIWCRTAPGGELEVAIHAARILGSWRSGTGLGTHRRLAELAEAYGVGQRGRTSRSRVIVLSREFVAEVLAGPCDERVTMTVTHLYAEAPMGRHRHRHTLRHTRRARYRRLIHPSGTLLRWWDWTAGQRRFAAPLASWQARRC